MTVFQKVGKPWRGYRICRGGSGCDGIWQPAVRISVVFEALEHKKLKDDTNPDICAKCARELVQKLLDQIPTPDRISLAVTQEH